MCDFLDKGRRGKSKEKEEKGRGKNLAGEGSDRLAIVPWLERGRSSIFYSFLLRRLTASLEKVLSVTRRS